MLAVGESHARQVKRPPIDTRDRERLLEELGRVALGRGDRRRRASQEGESRRKVRDVRFMRCSYVSRGLVSPSCVYRGFDEVHDYPKREWDIRREGARRADRRRLLVRFLVVTTPERGERARVTRVLPSQQD